MLPTFKTLTIDPIVAAAAAKAAAVAPTTTAPARTSMTYTAERATGTRTTPTSATHVWCANLTPPSWRRKRADGADPCTATTSRVTVTHTKSTQQLCKEAGVPSTWLPICIANVEKKGMTVAEAAKAAKATQPIVREGRRSVIHPLCLQIGVPQDKLEACYQAVKQGKTPEEQMAIIQKIAEEMAAAGATAPMQPGQALPAGTIHYLNPATGVYHVAIPVGATLSGLGGAPTHTEAGTTTMDPTAQGSTPTTESDYKERTGTGKPLWKKWWFWLAVGGGALTLGGGGYYMVRRRRG
jgi:hypothetical protein